MATYLTKPVSFLRVASDLHLEYTKFNPEKDSVLSEKILLEMLPEDERDSVSILVLAGDICNFSKVSQLHCALRDRFPYIIHIPGNHEYYGGDLSEVTSYFCGIESSHPDFFIPTTPDFGAELYLPNGEYFTRILACTLWADGGNGNPVTEARVTNFGNDFSRIRAGSRKFTPKDMGLLNKADSEWLHIKLKIDPLKQDVTHSIVLTHYAPSFRLLHPIYKGEATNHIFASDQDLLFPKVDTWVFGHTHNRMDVELDGTRFISNPRGYPREMHCTAEYEPRLFIPIHGIPSVGEHESEPS